MHLKKIKLFFIVVPIIYCISSFAFAQGLMDGIIDNLNKKSSKARIIVAKTDIEANLSTALALYELDNEMLPTTEQGLLSFLEKPTISPIPKNWNGPYMRKMPKDPWGNNYVYSYPGLHNKDSYDLFSYGPDGIKSEDDIANWN